MKIVGIYSFNGGEKAVRANFSDELEEVRSILRHVDANQHMTKISKEKTMRDKVLYSPRSLNRSISDHFLEFGWEKKRVHCDYPTQFYTAGYQVPQVSKGAFREMDFIKNKLGVEVQFGKYSFMVYNVCAKMTIFHKMGFIDVGIEIVPVKELAENMSSGVSYFEQFVWDLERRGISNIDIPVMILGVAP
ncbi:BglII/BstYI family type II restriction endonuclease [Levilinea saccharolytica]|uniref:Restriction endonuclease BglII n=1 Tax=Levilinea saccharolytica TaxID=229921 RepID=A0A0P6X040_9CHLR|nr:BglII/BstYI family type II restriction endonuclease [Levilinea saccharolytica]KPL75556.1 restriction endonuclease BglII [Levilinea saccharolytica]GAP17015.1 restriction endonuclease BglII [Levilinea saccharolytica]